MSKFDTHGDYFAPQGYMRVNAGGSHEENPNGGVQVGVDPEGVPNVLEEGEPVYNDYVYSDNIVADKKLLEANNLPVKYAGKLYSEIADLIIDEAAETPLDPIANNGLNAMLVRLADAQEQQKAEEQQRELENELSQMSPEELEALEAALAEQEMQNAQMQEQQAMPMEAAPEQMMQKQVPVEAPVMEQPMSQMPIMACGGKIKRYDTGGNMEDDDIYSILKNIEEQKASQQEINAEVAKLRGQLSEARINRFMTGLSTGIGNFFDYVNTTPEDRLFYASNRLKGFPSLLKSYAQGNDPSLTPERLLEIKKGMEGNVESAREAVARKQERRASRSERVRAAKEQVTNAENALRNYVSSLHSPEQVSTNQVQIESPTDTVTSVLPSAAASSTVPVDTANIANYDKQILELKKKFNLKKDGGKINRYDWGSFLNQVRNYTGSRARSADKHYRIDPNFYKRYGFNSIEDLENSEPYKAFTRYVLANSNNPEVLDYLRAIDSGVAQGNNVPMLFDSNGNLKDDWHDQYIRLRKDKKGGIYHFMGDTADDFQGLSGGTPIASVSNRYVSSLGVPNGAVGNPASVYLDSTPIPHTNQIGLTTYNPSRFVGISTEQPDLSNLGIRPGVPVTDAAAPSGLASAPGAVDANGNPVGPGTPEGERALPVWPRYAGAATAGLLGLHNVFQEPDRYDLPHVNPVLPYGRMHLIDPVYNPLDQNQVTNTLLANAAGTSRAIRNSGNNPSVGATLLAQDYNTGQNMGNAAATVWDANNQRRNAVIAAHNQNASTLGNFHYGQNRDRAQILNSFALHNANNDWRNQYMNYQAEAQKYAAIQNQLDNLAGALAAIGQENFAMNQLRNNRALYYKPLRNGAFYYDPYTGEKLV